SDFPWLQIGLGWDARPGDQLRIQTIDELGRQTGSSGRLIFDRQEWKQGRVLAFPSSTGNLSFAGTSREVRIRVPDSTTLGVIRYLRRGPNSEQPELLEPVIIPGWIDYEAST